MSCATCVYSVDVTLFLISQAWRYFIEARNASKAEQNAAVNSTSLFSARANWKADARALELSEEDIDEVKALSVRIIMVTHPYSSD